MTERLSGGAPELTVTELRLNRAAATLTAAFGDGASFVFPAELLRVMSPSAEVQGHAPNQRQTVPGKRKVGIKGLEPVGNYAVRVLFDDGHDTGIFSWAYLRDLGENQDERWNRYLSELTEKNLSRDA